MRSLQPCGQTSLSVGLMVPSLYDIGLDAQMYAVLGAERWYAADEHLSDPMRALAIQRADALIAELKLLNG